MSIIRYLDRIERIDQLIRMKATGTPAQLAQKIGISDRSIRLILHDMRSMGAKVYYCPLQQSYLYKEPIGFFAGFTQQTNINSLKKG